MSDNPHARPLLVTLIAIIYILIGIGILIMGIGLNYLTVDNLVDAGIDSDLADLFIGFWMGFAVLGVIVIVIAIGFLRGWSVMWYLGVIFTIISLLLAIGTLILTGGVSIIGLIVDVVILFYLFRPNVKLFFLGHE
ncbi:MAG: hypothetical protein Q4Q58_05455 [Thermoplasmata archaeon]|nr:hypothetical protein [Thermoplasmata archaeon]